jgi:antitoxin component YwqK of YwqJK toxin-antitoxin module
MRETFFTVFMSVLLLLNGCSEPNPDYEVLQQKSISCPDGAHVEYKPWGKSGLQRACVLNHGPVVMAESGKVVIEGEYTMGKKTGEWRWFDASGKLVKSEKQ